MDQQALQALRELAEKLGTTVDQAWPLYVRYQQVACVVSIIGAIVIGIAMVAMIKIGARRLEAWREHSSGDSYVKAADIAVYRMAGWIFPVLLFLAASAIIAHSLPGAIAPEGYAISKLIGK